MENFVYAVVGNIPKEFHSRDLRAFFSEFVELRKLFCFHFRHRPEIQIIGDNEAQTSSSLKDDADLKKTKSKSFCCVVKLTKNNREEFISKYHGQPWTNYAGNELPQKCFISKVKLSPEVEKQEKQHFLELSPPPLMPNGNVGTPSAVFFRQIQQCKLPSSIVKKLGLRFPKSYGRKYSQVPFAYEFKTKIPRSVSNIDKINVEQPGEAEAEAEESDSTDEDWERHEALHDIPEHYDRSDPKLYEEEQEIVWEKGGPGLVFYTDDFYFAQQEGDDDEKEADSWDVDMRIYDGEDEAVSADRDSQDAIEMRKETLVKSGVLHESVFRKKKRKLPKAHDLIDDFNDQPSSSKMGVFEFHTKGIGRKIMETHGWKEGKGLGKSTIGRPLPISAEDEGQLPNDKKGFGYRGEKLQRTGFIKPKSHLITTIYDNPVETDPPEELFFSKEDTWNKHR